MLLNPSSVRTYPLRSRARAEATTQPSRALGDSPSLIDINISPNETAPQQDGPVPQSETHAVVRMYSDVVAQRSPSPRGGRNMLLSEGSERGPDHTKASEQRNTGSRYDSDSSHSSNDGGNDSNGVIETPD